MKMNKILAVLLTVVMLVAAIPVYLAPTVSAADVGTIINGGFETGDFTGWEYYYYSTSIGSSYKRSGSYGVKIGKDSSLAGHVALEQIVPVNTNATYNLTYYNKRNSWGFSGNCSFSVTVDLGNTATSFTYNVVSNTPSNGNSFSQRSHSFSTTTYKYARIRFNALGSGVDTCLDDIALTATNEGDTSTHAKPTFVDFGNELNRPKNSDSNVVKQPSFESTTNAQWNTSSFIKTNLSVVNDPDAKDGSKSLLYSNATNTESWHYFDLDLPTGGTYVLSAWVKSPYLSATNQGTASIGIIDPDTDKFFMSGLADYKGHTSTPFMQIRSTATDNEWHLRSVTFFVGSAGTVKIGVYGKMSQLYIDDISVHLVENGVTYVGDQTGTISPSNNTSNMYCESEDNLIPDCNMTGANAKTFWTTNASGWNNGFMNFNETEQRLEFNGTGASGKKIYNYIKWIYVEPNTQYTVSFDYRVTAKGSGQLRFLDNNIDLPVAFKTYSFSSTTSDWTTTSFTFNSGNYNRIAIAFTDGGGTAYFDDFRIFKSSDGISAEPEEEVYPTLKPSHPDEYVSRKEYAEDSLALGFLFNLNATGVTRNDETYVADYTNGKVDAFENGIKYKLVKVGAVFTNREAVGQDESAFTLSNLQGDTVIDVEAEKLYYNPESQTPGEIYFAMRIHRIPAAYKETIIYARPYYIFEYEDREITVYGDIVFDSYEPQKDVNDGWLEWD